jgi:hypothetical protein
MLRKVIVPTSLADIKLKDFQRFYGANPTDENGEELALAIFCGIDKDEYKQFPVTELEDIKNLLGIALSEKPEMQRFVDINGTKYGFHPNLEDISMGEFVDLEAYMKDPVKNAEKWLGIVYRPVVKEQFNRYEIEAYRPDIHNGEAFEDITMDVVQGALLFFYRLEIALLASLTKSFQQAEKQERSLTQDPASLSDGDGTQSYINWLTAMYGILKP